MDSEAPSDGKICRATAVVCNTIGCLHSFVKSCEKHLHSTQVKALTEKIAVKCAT